MDDRKETDIFIILFQISIIIWNKLYKSFSSFESKYCFSSTFKFVEFVASPSLLDWGVVFKSWNGSNGIVTLFNMSFITFIYVVMEWILEWKGVSIISSLNFNCYSTNNSFIWSPWVGNESGGIEQSWSNDVGFKIFLYSAFFHVPSDNFDWCIGIISDLDLM